MLERGQHIIYTGKTSGRCAGSPELSNFGHLFCRHATRDRAEDVMDGWRIREPLGESEHRRKGLGYELNCLDKHYLLTNVFIIRV
eukprot:scaffold187793_cov55-Attheya_sp.AAC.3